MNAYRDQSKQAVEAAAAPRAVYRQRAGAQPSFRPTDCFAPKPKIVLWHEEPLHSEGTIIYSTALEMPDGSKNKLWYRVPEHLADTVTESADPFVIGALFIGMSQGADLTVHSRVSPSLLKNLMEFQNAWFTWCPRQFRRIEILPDREEESSAPEASGEAICSFSGGLDSLFSVMRHRFAPMGRQKRNIKAALVVQGFDIPVEEHEEFQRRAMRCNELLSSAGVELMTVATNFKDINPDWNHAHGAGVASCLSLFKRRFSEGIIAGTYDYSRLLLPWGSNPLTDPLLSSRSFEVVHDAAHWSRIAKLQALYKTKREAYDSMIVCFSNRHRDENCCRCFKCTLTILLALAADLPAPKSFKEPLTPASIMSLQSISEFDLFGCNEFVNLLHRSSAVPHALAHAMKRCVKFNNRRVALEKIKSKGTWSPIGDLILNAHKTIGMCVPF